MSLFNIKYSKKNNIFSNDINAHHSPNKNLNVHFHNRINKEIINRNFKKIYNLINNKEKIDNRSNNRFYNNKIIFPRITLNAQNGINILNDNINKIKFMNANQKVNRILDYSYNIRNHIGDKVRGARNLKKNINIIPPNFRNCQHNENIRYSSNYKSIDNDSQNSFTFKRPNSLSKIGKIIISNNNKNNINNNKFKIFNNNLFINKEEENINKKMVESIKYKINNLKLNYYNNFNPNVGRIFMKEEYSNLIRRINWNILQNQRVKKYENYFNIVLNYKMNDLNNIWPNKILNTENNITNFSDIFKESGNEDEKIINNISNSKDELNNNIEENNDFQFDDESKSNDLEIGNEEIDESSDTIICENPLEVEIIENLPVTKLNDIEKLSDENKKCTICFEIFNKDDNIIYLPCIHIYHEECIKEWFKKQNFCPICRLKISLENFNDTI